MTDQKPEDLTPDGDGNAVKPQVIDLVAEEVSESDSRPETDTISVEAEDIAAEIEEPARAEPETVVPPPPPPPPPSSPPFSTPAKKARRGTATWIIAALILGAIGGGWLYRDVLSGYFPTNEVKALQVRLNTLESSVQSQGNQIASLSQSADAATQAAASAGNAAKSAATGLTVLATRLDGFDQRIATAEESLAKASADIETLRNSVSTAGTGSTGGPLDNSAVAALGQRVDALEKEIASLKSATGGGDKASVTTALSQALADLKAKVAAGAGFAAEYDKIARMVPAAAGLDVLAANAQNGLPTGEGLAKELRDVIPSLPQPTAPAPASDSYWTSLLDSLSGIISIREIGESNWPQLAENAAGLAQSGDIAQAISLIDVVEGDKPVAVSQWRERAGARLKLEAAVTDVSEAVLRQIAALGGTP